MPKTEQQATVGWDSINWPKLERAVFKLQNRIYQASKQENIQVVRQLQPSAGSGYLNPERRKNAHWEYRP